MVPFMVSTSWETTGAPVPKLNCPQIPHMGGSVPVAMKQEAETPEQLRLSPAVHRDIVPAEQEPARTKRTVRLPPAIEQVSQHVRQDGVELREATSEQRREVDAFGIV